MLKKSSKSALVSQLFASLGTSVPLLLERLTRCQKSRRAHAHSAHVSIALFACEREPIAGMVTEGADHMGASRARRAHAPVLIFGSA